MVNIKEREIVKDVKDCLDRISYLFQFERFKTKTEMECWLEEFFSKLKCNYFIYYCDAGNWRKGEFIVKVQYESYVFLYEFAERILWKNVDL